MHSLILFLKGFIFCIFLRSNGLKQVQGQVPIKFGEYCLSLLCDNKLLHLFGFDNYFKIDSNARRTNFEKNCEHFYL